MLDGPARFDIGLVPGINHTYSLLASPGLQYPLYDKSLANPSLACDKSRDCELLDFGINYESYDNMELSGIPFMNFIDNLSPGILDPIDSLPEVCRRMQLLETFLSR